MSNFEIFTNQPAFVQKTTQAIESAVVSAQKARGEAHVALSGGKSPAPVYQALSQSEKIDWNRLSLWLVDERYVPAEDSESNQRMIRECFGSRIAELKAFHTFDTHLNPTESAEIYEAVLSKRTDPLFDLVLLGLGEDGHTASLFPGIVELNETERLALPTWAQGYTTPQRLTMTFPALLNSREMMFIVEGAKKKIVLDQLFQFNPKTPLPAMHLRNHPHLSFYFLNT